MRSGRFNNNTICYQRLFIKFNDIIITENNYIGTSDILVHNTVRKRIKTVNLVSEIRTTRSRLKIYYIYKEKATDDGKIASCMRSKTQL